MQLEQVEIKFTLALAGISTEHKMEAELRAKQAYVMTLLKQGAITKHRAATLLGITRLDLIELMGKYEISTFSEQTRSQIEQEVAYTREMLNQQTELRA